jgi:2-polyprenyl-6-methoxyphenol hydroxylase-like FAD-dependent oxidoreductase
MDQSETFDFVIAGAGPVGLSLGIALAKSGSKILVLEKKSELSEHSRAPGIWGRTLEVFQGLGVVEKFLEAGINLKHFEIWNADENRRVLRLDFSELKDETPFPRFLILPQSETEKILLAHLSNSSNVTIKFSSELRGLEQINEQVRITYESQTIQHATSSFLIGCDGAHSKVRELLGFQLVGETFPVEAALADIKLPGNPEYPFPRLTTKGHFAVGVKIRSDLWRLIMPFSSEDNLELAERIQECVQALFGMEKYELIWKSEFKLHNRLSTGFLKDRVILAGDAAHLNSPVGGQGMNSGIQDTEFLAPLLLTALENNNPENLLPYVHRKEEIKSTVNRFTTILTDVIFYRDGKYLPMLLKTMSYVLRLKPMRKRFIRNLLMVK